MVARFENLEGANPFDPIKLRGAITSPFDYDVSKNGILSAAIEYHTPYRYNISSRSLVPTWKDSLYLSYAVSTEFPMHFIQTKRASILHSQTNTDINTSSTPLVQFFPFNASPQFRSEFSDTSQNE